MQTTDFSQKYFDTNPLIISAHCASKSHLEEKEGLSSASPPSPPHQLDSNHDDATILSWTLALLYLEDILGRAIRM